MFWILGFHLLFPSRFTKISLFVQKIYDFDKANQKPDYCKAADRLTLRNIGANNDFIPGVSLPTTTNTTITTTTTTVATTVASSRLHGTGGTIPSIWAHQPPLRSGFEFFRKREFTGLRFRQPVQIISQQRLTAHLAQQL